MLRNHGLPRDCRREHRERFPVRYWINMTRFAVRQHDPLRSATGRRHHLNLLLHDYDVENDRTYGDRAPGLLSGTKLRDYHSVQETGRHSQTHQINSLRYAEQLPSLTKQALALSGGSQLMESVVSITGSDARTVPVSAVKPMHTGPSSTIVTAAPSWLTPQQLQNRQLGTKVAKMMSSHRTPIGAFANFDMPVAP